MQFKPFKIGKYLLLERLATGGMAEVYRAKASGAGGFEKQLAIKRIIPSYAENDEFRRMFEYEARLSSLLNHANIVHVYDFVKSGDTYLLALEFVDGKNLRQVVNKAKKANFALPIEFGVYVINEVCKGLDYAHNLKDGYQGKHLNVIHRDMSPQNIMISYDGAVKIVDFGIAKARDRVDETRSGVIKGKFGYMSPEQASGQEIDHRSDIFSTVIILYELLTNRRLFASENDMATLKRIQECIVQRPSLLNPKINNILEKLLLKGLTKDRSLRYQQAGELQQKLQEYLNKYYGSFNQNSVQHIMTKLFRAEMEQEKRRLEQVYQQSIPYSQQQVRDEAPDMAGLDLVLEGEQTKSEHEPESLVTKVSDPSIPAPSSEKVFDDHERLPEILPEEEAPATMAREEQSLPEAPDTAYTDNTFADGIIEDNSYTPSLQDIERSTGVHSGSRTLAKPKGQEIPDIPEDRTLVAGSTNADKTSVSDAADLVRDPFEDSFTAAPVSDPPPADAADNMFTNPGTANEKIELKLENDPTASTEPSPRKSRLGFSNPLRAPKPEKDPYLSEIPPAFIGDAGPSIASRLARMLTSALVLSALAGTLYYYFSIEDPNIENPPPQQRDTSAVPKPSEAPKAETQSSAQTRLAPGEKPCIAKVESDPSGAKLFIDGKPTGITPNSVYVSCNKKTTIRLEKSGYEIIEGDLTLRRPKQSFYRTLKKIPQGLLEITVTHNARIYLDGNLQEVELRPGVPTKIKVTSGKKHTVMLVNEALGLRVTKEYTVNEDEVVRDRIRLFNTPGGKRLPAKR
ncbi:MAG: serine/threonine protein kinase [Bdellovibrionales bacterium]|nr:serine/threonine protein kinase [Bdellovibrionales bacterium]